MRLALFFSGKDNKYFKVWLDTIDGWFGELPITAWTYPPHTRARDCTRTYKEKT